MTFDPASITRIVHMARAEGIDPAALLAVAEVESAGRPLEQDGITPRFLFERHVFYRALKRKEPSKLGSAVAAGLATPKWDRAVAYRDQMTHAGRMKVLASARRIDEECANQACSWGLGQVLGENAQSLGYDDATAMVRQLVDGGVPAQVESMMRFIRKNRLQPYLKMQDWAAFALRYNGPGYAQNRYDVKMAAAYRKWAAHLDSLALPQPETIEPEEAPPEQIEELPPPYVEPKTRSTSKSVWTGWLGQIVTWATTAYVWIADLPFEQKALLVSALVVLICFFGFLLRERLKKIAEQHT